MIRSTVLILSVAVALPAAAFAESRPVGTGAASHAPDPLGVQRHGPGYRYTQAGWVVVHIEGAPYDRGYQHGRILAPEIVGYLKCFAQQQSGKAPEEGWRATRTLVNALFLRKFDPEYLEEMKGIADGAAAAGAKFDGRAIDLVDIAAINCWAEIDTLDGALEATPTGLEGRRFPGERPKKMPPPPDGHCSAFAATGPATADGKIVFGHITMFGLPAANFYNVWLDVKPARGHRVVMQSFPGGIQSGMDYYITDAGLMVSETTITQTRFNKDGLTLASRIRKAVQYAESIDQIVEHLTKENNGLYTNEWLIGDCKTNEIAMLQLGTAKFRLSRSSKGEWFGDTPGFYWGCNNTKDLDLRLETIPAVTGRPANLVWHPSDRDKTWQRLYHQYKGKIDENFAKLAFTTPPLAAYHSLDAKYTTSDMTKRLQTHALFGPPLGRTWLPTDDEKKTYPDVRPLVSHPWTVLTAAEPPTSKSARVADLPDKVGDDEGAADEPPTVPAWYGTILPKTDGDVWLAAAFAEYERIVALEHALVKRSPGGKLSATDRDRLALELHAHRVAFTGSGGPRPVTLSAVRRDDKDNEWYRRAVGKGVWVMSELRSQMGPVKFDDAMESFGRAHAGKAVSSDEFQKHVERATKKDLAAFFGDWVRSDKLPTESDVLLVTVRSFLSDLEHSLIVYGTADEEAANRDAATVLQQALRAHGPNITVAVKADTAITPEDRQRNNLLLIGRPETNRVTAGVTNGSIRWGPRSFTVRDDTYANANSAVAYAVPNGEGHSAVVIAGLGAAATRDAAVRFTSVLKHAATAVVLPVRGAPRYLVLTPRAEQVLTEK
jgi:hypothetical protein